LRKLTKIKPKVFFCLWRGANSKPAFRRQSWSVREIREFCFSFFFLADRLRSYSWLVIPELSRLHSTLKFQKNKGNGDNRLLSHRALAKKTKMMISCQ